MLRVIINVYIEQIQKWTLYGDNIDNSIGPVKMINGKQYQGDGRNRQLYFPNIITEGECNFNVDNMTQSAKLVFSRVVVDNLISQLNNGIKVSQKRISKLEDEKTTLQAEVAILLSNLTELKEYERDDVIAKINTKNQQVDVLTKSIDFILKDTNSTGNVIERGDAVIIETGYEWNEGPFDNTGKVTVRREVKPIYAGFISKINYNNPIEIELEDFSFILKNVSVPTEKIYKSGEKYKWTFTTKNEPLWVNGEYDTSAKGNSVAKMINTMLSNTVWNNILLSDYMNVKSDDNNTSVGKWVINGSVSIMQFLEEIKSKCKLTIFNIPTYTEKNIVSVLHPGEFVLLKNFFNNLHVGIVKYYPGNYSIKKGNLWVAATPIIFDFQHNIIDKNLEYRTKDDVKIKLIAYGAVTERSGVMTKGSKNVPSVEKKKEYRVLPSLENGVDFIGDIGGDVRTLYFFPPEGEGSTYNDLEKYYIDPNTNEEKQFFSKVPDNVKIILRSKTLRKQATQQYRKLNSTSILGSFTTFGYPFVDPGNIIQFKDSYKEEQTSVDGKQFMVKGVRTFFGVSTGLRQEIFLDYQYDTLTDDEKIDLNKGKL